MDRFGKALDAARRGDRREFAVQTMAHEMCRAALGPGRIAALLAEADRRGITLTLAEDGTVKMTAAKAPPRRFVTELRRNKAAIIAELRTRATQ